MIIAVPLVTRLKCLRSAGRCQGSLPSLPITPLSARATTMVTWGSSISRSHPSGGAPRKVALCGDPEGWGPDRVSMDASLRWPDGEEHHHATGAGMRTEERRGGEVRVGRCQSRGLAPEYKK